MQVQNETEDLRDITDEERELCRRSFAKWMKRFGFGHWDILVTCDWESDEGDLASVTWNSTGLTARMQVCEKINQIERFDAEAVGRHEAIHVLIGKLHDLAGARYVEEREVYNAVEEVVMKLEKAL